MVKGFQDLEQRMVLVEFVLDLPTGLGKNNTISEPVVKAVTCRNLTLRSEWHDAEKEALEETSTANGDDAKTTTTDKLQKGYVFLEKKGESGKIVVEKNWQNLLDDNSPAQSLVYLKSLCWLSLDCIAKSLPSFGPKDIAICHRQDDKSVWHLEAWTLREFAAFELAIAPVSTELKDVHWTRNASAMVTTSANGPCRHPEGKTLAFDGRGRTTLASANFAGATSGEKRGVLFWVVPRTSTKTEANLRLESVAVALSGSFKLPNSGKRQKVEYLETDTPQVPVMVNPSAIAKHVRLTCLEDPKFAKIRAASSPASKK